MAKSPEFVWILDQPPVTPEEEAAWARREERQRQWLRTLPVKQEPPPPPRPDTPKRAPQVSTRWKGTTSPAALPISEQKAWNRAIRIAQIHDSGIEAKVLAQSIGVSRARIYELIKKGRRLMRLGWRSPMERWVETVPVADRHQALVLLNVLNNSKLSGQRKMRDWLIISDAT